VGAGLFPPLPVLLLQLELLANRNKPAAKLK
jgi:hypothetical protein